MKALIILFSIATTSLAQATPTAYCTEGKSKPCGQGCISVSKTCRKSWTTAVIGERPASEKPGFATPKFVESVPQGK